jgi:hypothetical protein
MTDPKTNPLDDRATDAAPALEPVRLLAQPPSFAFGVTAFACCIVAAGAFWQTSGTDHEQVLSVATGSTTGAFRVLQQPFQDSPGSVLAQIDMAEPDKERLRAELADGQLRLAQIRLWDTAAEDGDQIEVSSAGFLQRLTIRHRETIYFVPIMPGGAVRLRAVHDGGGGVTLGVATSAGRVPLPPLAVGQTLELPAL